MAERDTYSSEERKPLRDILRSNLHDKDVANAALHFMEVMLPRTVPLFGELLRRFESIDPDELKQNIQPESSDPNHYKSVLEYVLTEVLTAAHAARVERHATMPFSWRERLDLYAQDRGDYFSEPRLAARALLNQWEEKGIIEKKEPSND